MDAIIYADNIIGRLFFRFKLSYMSILIIYYDDTKRNVTLFLHRVISVPKLTSLTQADCNSE